MYHVVHENHSEKDLQTPCWAHLLRAAAVECVECPLQHLLRQRPLGGDLDVQGAGDAGGGGWDVLQAAVHTHTRWGADESEMLVDERDSFKQSQHVLLGV